MGEVKNRNKYGIAAILVAAILLTGCNDKETTVADDITGENPEYVEIAQFAVKEEARTDLTEIGYVALYVPGDYVASEETPGMYVSSLYPLDSSNIYYTRADASLVGAVDQSLTAPDYEAAVEAAYEAMYESPIDLTVDEFDDAPIEGIPAFKIRSHYTLEDRDVQMLCYLILSTDTYVITYTQMSDDELFADFETGEGQIRLVKEVSGK